ncbi:MAG: M55 family metallopeptidase, partial [Burkholderiales bacterium]
MKILVSVDIEGVAGVYHAQQTHAGNPEYERARRWMTDEANAAVEGAFAAGATEVYVNDSHGDFRNLLPDALDARAQVIQGKPRYLSMVAGVDMGVDGVCMVGYHSRAQGTGILAHTINSFAFASIAFNGDMMSEAGIYGALAGEYGVPVLMGSGDDVFIVENRPLFPRAVFVQTKRATGQTSGVSLSPAESCRRIRAGVMAGMAARPNVKPLVLQTPLNVSLRTQTPALADLFCQWPNFERVAPTELRFDAPTVEAAVRMLNCCSAMSAVLR